jgi:hypothetical protein
MSTKRNTVLAVVLCAAVGIAVGTLARRVSVAVAAVEATDGYHPADTETARLLGQRATEYWKARTRQDLYGAYPFYEASFRSTYQPEAFVKTFQRLNRFAPELVAVERIDVDASGTRARVVVKLRSKPAELDGKELITTFDDVWMLADGAWWRQAEAMTPTI